MTVTITATATAKPIRRAQRVRRRHIEIATQYYRRGDGHVVVLVGLMHMADKEFYDGIQAEVEDAERQGAIVQYEKVIRSDAATLAAARPWERDAVEHLDQRYAGLRETAAAAGLVNQREGLTLHPAWTNIDVSDLATVRALGFMPAGSRRKPKPLPAPDAQRALLRLQCRIETSRLIRRNPVQRLVTIDWRDIVAATAILGVQPSTPVVSLWGANHLPGIGKILCRNGYTLARTQWRIAVKPQTATV